jgi:molybdate transport system regulatory protein
MALKLRCKVWLEGEGGTPVIGEGRLRILTAIRRTGSISKAARMLNVPYRKAWGKIKDAERELGCKIVEATRTGTKLTAKGEDLVARFAMLHKSCQRSARSKFKKVFSSSSGRAAD